jgi:lipopolysaccharide transport protein LptA
MAASFRTIVSSRACARLALACAGWLAFAPALLEAAGPRRSDLPISLQAASSDFDYRNNTLRFRQVQVTQGTVSVEADEANATGLNFENSNWTFRGNVRIEVEGGSLSSDEAQVTFVNNQIERAVIKGSPASFQHQLKDAKEVARGNAATIQYDFASGTVRLTEDAYLTDGRNDIRGQTLVYSINEQRVLADAGEQGDQRVRITIKPRSLEDAQTETPDRPQ